MASSSSREDLCMTWAWIFEHAPWNPCRSIIEGCEGKQQLKSAPRHKPQRERSDQYKVRRWLREPRQNSDCARTRAIPHAKRVEKVAREMSTVAAGHNDADLTGTQCGEGAASDICAIEVHANISQGPEKVFGSNPGLLTLTYTTKKPSVWTHCSGNYH